MQVNLVGSSSSTQAVSQAVASAVDQATSAGSVPTEQHTRSGPAKLFKELEAMAKSDPEKFKKVTAELAKTVQAAADQATDPREKQMLGDLAKKFADASQSGDASALKPPGGRGGPRGHGDGDGDGGKGGGGAAKTFDAADTNQDGTVSAAEAAAYELKQQSKAAKAYSHSQEQSRESKGKALFAQLEQVVQSA
jgi:HSP90 family molecular chaperone